MIKYKKKTYKAIFCFIIYISMVCFSSYAQQIPQDEIVAKVNGKKIFYREIMLSQKLQNRYLQSKYGEKLKQLTDDEINRAILLEEKKNLLGIIKYIIKEEKIKKWQISVTSEEINSHIELSLKDNNLSIEGLSKKMKEGDRALLKALSAYLKDPQREDEIYAELKQKYGYSKLAWNGMKEKYNTPEKIEKLKKIMQFTLSSLEEDLIENFRPLILNEKFRDYITGDISVSESELKEFYKRQYPLAENYPEANIPKYDEVKDMLVKKLLERKKREKLASWWLAELKKANIEVLDERYKDFMDLLELPQEMELSEKELKKSEETTKPEKEKDTSVISENNTKTQTTLYLKNGQTITGTIIQENKNSVKIKTNSNIEFTIKKENIDRIE